jgi:hypothetical protein
MNCAVSVQWLQWRVQWMSAPRDREHGDDHGGEHHNGGGGVLQNTGDGDAPEIAEHGNAQEPNDPQGCHPGRLTESMGQGRADDEGIRGDDQNDGGHIGKRDGQGHPIVHRPLHVQADGGCGGVHAVELSEEPVGQQGQETGHQYGYPGGISGHIGDQSGRGQIFQRGKGESGRGGDDGALTQRTPKTRG